MESPKKPDTVEHFLRVFPQEDGTSKLILDDMELKGVSKVDFMMDRDTGGLKSIGIIFTKIGYKVEGEINED